MVRGQRQKLFILTRGKAARLRFWRMHPLTALFTLLAVIALIHMIVVAQTGGPGNAASDCDSLIRTTDYAYMLHVHSETQELEAVQLTSQLTGGEPSALVEVMNTGPQHALDVYIYGCIMEKQGPRLNRLFQQRGLLQGTVTISPANTLVTSELDPTLGPEASTFVQPLQQNIYREYAWRGSSFVQVSFPGLYPVTSRSEAEQLQQLADHGEPQPWSDPLVTAEQMVRDLLGWPANPSRDAVMSNDGATARVLLIHQQPQIEVTVTLRRLIQQDSTGLWFVTSAQTAGITLEQPQGAVSSPISLRGAGALPGGQTTATLFDHMLTPINTLNNATLDVAPNGTYAGRIYYAHLAPGQQGLLLIESLPAGQSRQDGQLLLTSILLG